MEKEKGHGDTSWTPPYPKKRATLTHPPYSNFSKRKRRLEMQYFKTAASCRKADFSGLVVRQRSYYQKKRADNPYALWLRVIGSASMRLALLIIFF